jgi:hypothetical protein
VSAQFPVMTTSRARSFEATATRLDLGVWGY